MFNLFNFKLKLTPIWLFLILLAVLVVAVIYGVNTYKEGLVSFKRSDDVLKSIQVEWYQNPLYKLYDNNFVDTINGNIVRVYEDNAGSIIKYTITDRSGVTTDYSSGYKATLPTTLTDTVKPWSVSNYDNYGYSGITNNAIVYMPWGSDTYIRTLGEKNTSFYIGGCTTGDDNCTKQSSEHTDVSLTTPIIEPVLSEVPEALKSFTTYITTKTNKVADGVYYDLSGCIYVFTSVDATTSDTTTSSGKLAAPTNVTAVLGSATGTVSVGFTLVPNAVSYSVKPIPTSGTYTKSPTTGTASPILVTDSLMSGTSYTFEVTAISSTVANNSDGAKTAAPLTITAASLPVITKVDAQNAQAAVTFTPPSGATAETMYTVTAKEGTVVAKTAEGKSPQITVTGLENGKTYKFEVKIKDSTITSLPSADTTVYPNRFTSNNVKFYETPSRWGDVSQKCLEDGKKTVSIKNEKENETIKTFLSGKAMPAGAWLSGSADNGITWKWVDDDTEIAGPGKYANWDGDFTPSANRRLAITSDGKWKSTNKDGTTLPYICSEGFTIREGLETTTTTKTLQIKMYKRDGEGKDGTVITTKPPALTVADVGTSAFKPWSLSVSTTKSILVIPRKTNTFIVVINKSANGKYTVESPAMYTPSVKLTVAPASNAPTPPPASTPPASTPPPSSGSGSGSYDDYILKTQVVPPVCPACPGTCTSGGSSGSLNSSSASSVSNSATGTIKSVSSDVAGLGKDVVSGGVGLGKEVVSGGVGLAKDITSTGVGLGKDVVTGGVGLGKEIVTGGIGLGKDVVTGSVGLVKDTVSGGVGLVKDTVSGGVGLVTDTVSGGVGLVKNVGSGSVKTGYRASGSGSGSKTNNDVYTYNGALTNKESSNYIPLTANFSAFSK
jgi:hypothetical protein